MPILKDYSDAVNRALRFVGLGVFFLFLSACDNRQDRWERFTIIVDASLADLRGEEFAQPIAQDPIEESPPIPKTEPQKRSVSYLAQFDLARFADKPWIAEPGVYFYPGSLIITLPAQSPETLISGEEALTGDALSAPNPTQTPRGTIQNIFDALSLDGRITPLADNIWHLEFNKQGIDPTHQISPNLDFVCFNVRDTIDMAIITACVQDALIKSGAFVNVERDFIYQPAYRLAAASTQIPAPSSNYVFTDDKPQPKRKLAVLTGPIWENHPDLDGLDVVDYDTAHMPQCERPFGVDGTPVARANAVNMKFMNHCGGRLSTLLTALLDISKAHKKDDIELEAVRYIAMPFSLAQPCPNSLQIALDKLRLSQYVLLAASGDHGQPVRGISPAGCSGVVSIAPTQKNGTLTRGANYGGNIAGLGFGGQLDQFDDNDRPKAPIIRQYAELCTALDDPDAPSIIACYDGWGEGSGLALMSVIDQFMEVEQAEFLGWTRTLTTPKVEQCEAPCEAYVGTAPISGRGTCLRACGRFFQPVGD